jgi:hypothetical protein
MNYRVSRYTLYNTVTREFLPLPSGVVILTPATVVGTDGPGLAADVVEAIGAREVSADARASITVPPDATVLPPESAAPVDGDLDETAETDRASAEEGDPAADLPEDKDALIDILDGLDPSHEFNKRHGVDTLQDAIRALLEG